MKKILLIIIVFSFFSTRSNATIKQPDFQVSYVDTLPTTQLITFLEQLDIESFYGKPVDSFLLAVDAIPYNMKVYGGSNSQGAHFRASYLRYHYSGGPVVRIYVDEYIHMNRYSSTFTWDVNLFKQEKISKIEVYKDQNTCINGSCMH